MNGAPRRELVNGERAAGRHIVAWDGRIAEGRPVPAGMYFYRLASQGGSR